MFPFRKPQTPPPPPASDGKFFTIVCAAGIGAGLMYLLDPDNGRRRRAMLKDKSVSYARELQAREDALVRQTLHHVQGALAAIRGRMAPSGPVDDAVLTERVRAALGHVIADAHAIDVKVRDGCVILKGPVIPEEIEEIVACAERVRGVLRVENRLSPNPGPGASPH